MKKIYLAPEIEVIVTDIQCQIMETKSNPGEIGGPDVDANESKMFESESDDINNSSNLWED